MPLHFQTKEALQKTVEVFKSDVALIQNITKPEAYLNNMH